MSELGDLYRQARRDAVTMCGFAGIAELTPAQALKVDLIASLRICIDNVSGRLISGSDDRQDLGKLISACEQLTKLLPTPDIAPPDASRSLERSARQKMEELIDNVVRANQFEEMRTSAVLKVENDKLRSENEALRAQLPAPADPKSSPSAPAKPVPTGGPGFTPRASWDK
jgi:hypothetical protein